MKSGTSSRSRKPTQPWNSPLSIMKTIYQCQRCTACCRWPGDVTLATEEIPALAQHLKMTEDDFVQQHTRLNRSRTGLSLLEHPNGTCVWLDGRDCQLQEVKPRQCRGFPNDWNFPGWQNLCQAIAVPADPPRE